VGKSDPHFERQLPRIQRVIDEATAAQREIIAIQCDNLQHIATSVHAAIDAGVSPAAAEHLKLAAVAAQRLAQLASLGIERKGESDDGA